jgi:hypothetical protein
MCKLILLQKEESRNFHNLSFYRTILLTFNSKNIQ